ncbi:hypothetical protein M427DRAFT_502064 [Gonapodya prolifera JEL478]|uniref:Uncharacterized protein n=1 Tax=Gonapodya prolifera (strain JEL478) TaxID=1344416 RepID=A0A139A8L6_GONPJ|nr:hypothetical protein M427DRAFT_502064 [Gonapodya prolifera JEL478]|eukprot:KXS12733.1 hypothetical protein M427DRAFT_502064 [Gonapodya prolifera JEL478]
MSWPGICFVANAIKAVGAPNLMISTIRHPLAFAFVFTTPLISSSETSVTESVARGVGTSSESVPVLWSFPSLANELHQKVTIELGARRLWLPWGELVVWMGFGTPRWRQVRITIAVGVREESCRERTVPGQPSVSSTSTASPDPVARLPSQLAHGVTTPSVSTASNILVAGTFTAIGGLRYAMSVHKSALPAVDKSENGSMGATFAPLLRRYQHCRTCWRCNASASLTWGFELWNVAIPCCTSEGGERNGHSDTEIQPRVLPKMEASLIVELRLNLTKIVITLDLETVCTFG